MSFLDRVTIAPGVYPFTPETYDVAYADRLSNVATSISPSRAEGVPMVYICTRVVSEDTAKVALHIFENLGQDAAGRSLGKRKAIDHPWYDALHHESNQYQTAIDFREMITAFALNRGRGVAKKLTRTVGRTVRRELEPLHPDLVTRKVTAGGDEVWHYQNPRTQKEEKLLADEVLVVWGPRRRSVIDFIREQLAIMLAGQEMQTQTLRRGPRHTGVITRPKEATKWDDKARENFRKAIDEYMGEGDRAGRPMLLEDGMTWINSSFSMADTEFVASAQLSNAIVCGSYRVPQHKAGLLERSTNNNIQQQATDYVVDCLLAWAVRWEQAIRMSLLVDPFVAEHNLRTLLRGDPKTAAETAAIYGSLGWLLGNESREDEGRNPLPELWEPRLPLNMGNVPGTSVAEVIVGGQRYLSAPGQTVIAPVDLHHRAMVRDGAARVVRKELQTLAKLRERSEAWEPAVIAFYRDHAEFVAKVLRIDDERAAVYCAARCREVLEDPEGIDEAEDRWISTLTTLTLAIAPEGAAA